MNVDTFNKKLSEAINAIGEALPKIIDERANNAIALIKNRFIQQGLEVDESGNEVAFPAYSESYRKRKEKRYGPQTANRLVLTGDMLRKLQIVNRQASKNIYTASVGGSDQLSEEKLGYNSERYGDVLKLSNEEIKTLQDAATEDIVEIFKNALE